MKKLRRFYRKIHVLLWGYLPLGELVQFMPWDWAMSAYIRENGDPEIGAVGMVIGRWEKDRFPDYGLDMGSLVLFDGKPFRAHNWELKVLDEAG